MKIFQYTIAFVILVFSCAYAYAQTSSVYDPSKDPRVYLRPFYDRLDIKADKDAETDCDERHFMRWLNVWANRIKPDGTIIDMPNNAFSMPVSVAAKTTGGNTPAWKSLGPSNSLPGSGIGMVHCIAFNPNHPNIIYAGAAAGGFWISTDTGAHWTATTDQMGSLGIDDIVLDPQHPDTIYAATGDMDFWSCLSIGLIRSTDGGYTWSQTGLTFNLSDGMEMIRVCIDPTNTAIMYAAAKTDNLSSNIYKSTDRGNTWNIVYSINEEISDMVMRPGSGNRLYFGTRHGGFYGTTDGGATWNNLTSNVGYLMGGGEVVTLAVCPAAPDNVYLMEEGNPSATDTNCGVYVSTNDGQSFTKMADNATAAGQAVQWYGYVMAVSPTNPNRIYVGGGYVYQSDDGGSTFTGTNSSSVGSFMHVDIHWAAFRTNNEVYVGCDGGIYRCNNLSGPYWTWKDVSGDMTISQLYGFSSAANSKSMFVMGMQDNGSGVVRGDKMYNYGIGGDGMMPAVNPLDSNNYYEAAQTGDFFKTNDAGQSWVPFIYTNINGEYGAWTTPITIDAQDTNVVWTGYQNVWKTRDQGVTWYKIGAVPPNAAAAPIQNLYIAPSDTNIVYILNQWGYGFLRTVDNGNHWTADPYPPTGTMSYFTVDSSNPYHLWATTLNYDAGQKIFESFDTGNTWINISYNLPNVGTNSAIYENKPPHRLFAGTEAGVYFLSYGDTMWHLFGTGMPHVNTIQLEIHNLTNTLRAGTYGRGLWECSLDTVAANLAVSNINSNNANQINIFPNPAKNSITVTSTNGINKVQIFNLPGQEVFKGQYNNKQLTIDISHYVPGIYFIKVNDLWVKRFMKE